MTFLHGDDRFYNNIFVQGWPADAPFVQGGPREHERLSGTWCFDEYPTYEEWISWFDMDAARPDMHKLEKYHNSHLPVWIDGNVYLSGAKAWKNEKHALVCENAKVEMALYEKDGKPYLKTNLFDFIGEFGGQMIHSDLLGNAFEPDQRFESPDGSAITFDRDYFGNHRGMHVAPGPFVNRESLEEALW